MMNLKEIDIKNTDGYEVLGTMGNILGHARKIIILACYTVSYTHLTLPTIYSV